MASLSDTWIFSLNDTDPVFRYQPYADGQFENGWEVGFTGVGLSPPDQDHNDGSGQSFHITSFLEASVSLSFFGVGVSLFGKANCSYDVVLDGSLASMSTSPPLGTLYTGSNLDSTVHNITLVPHPTSSDQTLNFTGAQLVAPASSSPTPERIDNQNTSVISYSGSWTVHNAHQIPSPDHPAPYFQTDKSGSSASLNFSGRAVAVRGESNLGWWSYLANLDGDSYSMNASSTFIIPDALLFYQDGLDENATHSLTLTSTGGDGMLFALNSITIYRSTSAAGAPLSSTSSFLPAGSQSSSPSSGSNRTLSSGALAGIVVGSVIAAAGLAGLVLLFLRLWRRRKEIVLDDNIVHPYAPTPISETTSVEPLAAAPFTARKSSAIQRAEFQDINTSAFTAAVNDRKLPAIQNEPMSTTRSPVSPTINPTSSSAIRQSGPDDFNQIAEAVVERLAMRFGSGNPNADGSPPSYPG
ncbi:hypothetical protein ACEPAI_505 [Sanghuangporus weigelae]